MKKLIFMIGIICLLTSVSYAQTPLAVGANGGYFVTTSDFGDLYKSSFGLQAYATYNFGMGFNAVVSVGYADLKFNNDQFHQWLTDAGMNANVDVNSKVTIIPIMAGLRYYFIDFIIKPYAEAQIGLDLITVNSADITINSQTVNAVKGASTSSFATSIGVGVLYHVFPKVSLDLSAKLHSNDLVSGTEFSVSGTGYSYVQIQKATTSILIVGLGLHIEL